MGKVRLEAFSDGVIAIIITIMVLEIHTPHDGGVAALRPLIPVILSYLLSFIFVGIYWNNHHHLFQVVHRVTGGALWANLHLLFWLSLVPFCTRWMHETEFAGWPVAVYGIVLFMSGVAFTILTRVLVRHHGHESKLAAAIGQDAKGWLSLVLYAIAIPTAFVAPWASGALYVVVATIWLVPDRRIERVLEGHHA